MKKKYLYSEFFVLFYIVPIVLFIYRLQIKSFIIPSILGTSLILLFFLYRDKSFNEKRLYQLTGLSSNLKFIFLRAMFGFVFLSVIIFFIEPEQLFNFPKNHFNLWILVIFIYPLFSVYFQEIIFRAFFFHRYKKLFNTKIKMIIASGFTFGFAHIIYGNWLAVVLSIIGGFIFANTYSKSKSLVQVSIEHGLWGDIIFTVGLGTYFYSGAIQ